MISPSTLLGIVSGVLILLWTVHHESSDWTVYLSLPSLLIVLGGTLTVTFIGYRAKYVVSALFTLLRIYLHQPITPKSLKEDVRRMVEWNRRVQNEGALAYDAIGKESKDEFVVYLFGLLSTGYGTDDIHLFATTHIEESYYRRLQASRILNSMASMTPALGLVGTLLGLITMLGKLQEPAKLGPGLALALTATLYGLLFARFIFLPTSTKAKQILSIERFRQYLLLEGSLLILQGKPALYVQDRLNSFLDPESRYDMNAGK